jgi:hypothetical protein
MLEKIQIIYFKFLWAGSPGKFVLHWVKLEVLSIPNALVGWGLKIIFLFSKVLAENAVLRLISSVNIWTNVSIQNISTLIQFWIGLGTLINSALFVL